MREPVKQLLTQIGAKKGAAMTRACLSVEFISLRQFYIPHNYAIPQAMPHAIPQTHFALLPSPWLKLFCLDIFDQLVGFY